MLSKLKLKLFFVKFRTTEEKMEDEICQFQKFGFYKFQGECKRKHLKEVCDSLSKCPNIKGCLTRHPKRCRRLESESGCRFKEKCAYNHQACKVNKEQNELKDKVRLLEEIVAQLTNKVENGKLEQLEAVVKALIQKTLSLESEIEMMKKSRPSQNIVNKEVSEAVKDKEEKTEKYILDDDCLPNNISFNSDDIKDKGSTPKEKEKAKKVETIEESILCTKCNYKCKKQSSLKKHMLTKHNDHVCKECQEKFQSLIEILKHVASHHHKDEEKVKERIHKVDSDAVDNDEEKKNFAFSESKFFDQFL